MTNRRSFYIHGGCDDGEELESLTSTDVTSLILSVVAQTGIKINSFVIDVRSGWLCGKRLPPSTFFQNPKFRDAWENLKELHLYVDLKSDSMSWAKHLMGLATNLRSVALDVCISHSCELSPELLDAATMRIRGLRTIALRSIRASDLQLRRFLDRSRDTLQSLSLESVTITRHDGVRTLFVHLQKGFPELRNLSLLGLHGELTFESTTTTAWVVFPTLSEKLQSLASSDDQLEFKIMKKGITGIDYTGRSMKMIFRSLGETAELWRPNRQSSSTGM
ncbi:MAG: hypothetical protein Q9225_001019 [Loekoesia sp. 1 TL-2023]